MNASPSSLPTIIIWLQALSVPVLGMLAAWIAFQQWRTAERKVQLDLFDRRFAIYDAARKALHPVIREGGAEMSDISEFRNATDKAFLLFGPEVLAEFEEVAEAVGKLAVSTAYMKDGPPYEEKHIKSRYDNSVRVGRFFENMPELIRPYMSLDHKLPASRFRIRRMRKPRSARD